MVKLNQAMTHESSTDPALYREFLAAIQPLKDAGKYHGLLAQFPWGFRRPTRPSATSSTCASCCPGEPLWVEFRHDSWMHPRLPDVAARALARLLRRGRAARCPGSCRRSST